MGVLLNGGENAISSIFYKEFAEIAIFPPNLYVVNLFLTPIYG
jgi:hypothetical protein